MTAADQLHSASGLRGATFKTLIGLLAATGLRPGEVCKLDVSHVDLAGRVFAVRESRFRGNRNLQHDAAVCSSAIDPCSERAWFHLWCR
jgi:integrase